MYSKTADIDRKVVDCLDKFAEKHGVPHAQVALASLLSKLAVTAPIVGATKAHHLDDAVGAVSLKLTLQEIAALEESYIPHPVLSLS